LYIKDDLQKEKGAELFDWLKVDQQALLLNP